MWEHQPTIDPGEAEHTAAGGTKSPRPGARSVKWGTPDDGALPGGRPDGGRNVDLDYLHNNKIQPCDLHATGDGDLGVTTVNIGQWQAIT